MTRTPGCPWHMAMVDPITRERLVAAFKVLNANQGTSSEPLRKYSNLLKVAREQVAAKIAEQKAEKPMQGALL